MTATVDPRSKPVVNAFTVDVEDYFQVTAFDHIIKRGDWAHITSRVEQSTRRLLDLLAEHNVRGTFFVLGWIAERFPGLVREIDARGHEIGSHSYWHRLVYQQTPDEFRADLRRSKQVLEDIISKPVECYRAPTFSIIPKSWWALEILVEEGFTTDSSIFPIRHDRYGMPNFRPEIHQIQTPSGPIWEAPLSISRFMGINFPASGGGYFRLYPFALTRRLFERINSAGRPVIFYVHPWEIDPDQPRVAELKRRRAWRHYVQLESTELKLRRLLGCVQFSKLGDVIKSLRKSTAPETWTDEPESSKIEKASNQFSNSRNSR